jgi:hypothetical protein
MFVWYVIFLMGFSLDIGSAADTGVARGVMGERKRKRPVDTDVLTAGAWHSFGQSETAKADLAQVAILARTSRGLHQVFKNQFVLDLHDIKMTGSELEAISRYYRVENACVKTNFPRNIYEDEEENPEGDRQYSIDHFRTMSCDIGPMAQDNLL